MEDGAIEQALEGGDGRFGDVTRTLLSVLLPKELCEVKDVLGWHGRETIPFRPLM